MGEVPQQQLPGNLEHLGSWLRQNQYISEVQYAVERVGENIYEGWRRELKS